MAIRSDYRIKLLRRMESEISNEDFVNESRYWNERSFSRSRFFTLRRLIVFIMILKTSYQRELNAFCKVLMGGDYNIRAVTAGALSQSRAKLNSWAFTRLNEVAINSFYKDADYLKWKTHRLLAIDGSVLGLPYSEDIVEEFGYEEYINKSSNKKSMARCSLLYDVLNHTTIDAQISGYRTSEKMLFELSLPKLDSNDVILGDRGYGYIAIMHWLSESNINFCFRIMASGHTAHKIVTQFTASNKSDTIVELPYHPRAIKSLQLNKNHKPLKVRLIKIHLDDEIEVLCTSLLEQDKYKYEEFKELYHMRWTVEEAYKMLKTRIELETFSGRTAKSIYQDFHAKVLMMTLCAVLTHPIEKKVRQEYKASLSGNKYDQQINRTDAIAETQNNLIHLFISKVHQKVIDIMDEIVIASRHIIRPDRKNPRIKSVRKRAPVNFKHL